MASLPNERTALAEIKDDMEAAVAAAIAKEEASMSMKAGLEERARVAEDKARKAVAAAEDLTASLIRKVQRVGIYRESSVYCSDKYLTIK